MKKLLLVLSVIGMLSTLMYYANDYGVSKTELTQTKADIEALATAETDRKDMELIESARITEAIDSKAMRDHYIEIYEQQAQDYEKALATARTTVCNLSADNITSMQHFAKATSQRQQLGKSTGISALPTAYQPGSPGVRYTIGNGSPVLHQRRQVLGCSMQPHQPAGSNPITPKAISTT